MEFYVGYFAALVLFNVALVYYRIQRNKQVDVTESIALPGSCEQTTARKFKAIYFGVYILATAADWLQGPYMYTLYKDEKALTQSGVAALFTTGFVAAAVSASFVGTLADQYGRRAACLGYCVAYSLSCLSVLSDDLPILFVGRALGGLSTTLLFSVFETWMIAEYHQRELYTCMRLGDVFSLSVTLSGVTAIVSGVVGEAIVQRSGTKIAPFLAAVICLAAASCLILWCWTENFGTTSMEKQQARSSLRSVLTDKHILTLAFATTCFEGSMYLFVFFWSPSLIAARAASITASQTIPFGLIFSCFMCAMMLGSQSFSAVGVGSRKDASRFLLNTVALAAISLLIPILAKAEACVFWSFALFEVCVGMYFPAMSRLKSELVEEAVRGKVYGLMRIPLNLFVVVALGLTREGDAHRNAVFSTSGTLLLAAFAAIARYLE